MSFMIIRLNLHPGNILIFSRESSPTQKISAIRCIHESFRFFLAAYRKDLFPKPLHFTDELNACFMELIDSDQLPMETLFNCCLSIVYTNKDNISALACWKVTNLMVDRYYRRKTANVNLLLRCVWINKRRGRI